MQEYSNLIDNIKDRLRIRFKDYTSCDSDDFGFRQSYNKREAIDRNLVPVPKLLYFLLVFFLEFSTAPREDKTHWIVPFRYRGTPCALALEKFGLFLYIYKEGELDHEQYAREIVGKLQKGVIHIEKKVLKPLAHIQIRSGHITVVNYYYNLRSMYDYFRECAMRTFEKASVHAPPEKDIKKAFKNLNQKTRLKWEGFFNTVAMIDAYFSLLEHILVFCLPFSDKKEKIDLSSFIGSNWAVKYKKVLSVKSGKPDKEFYDKLKLIKERIRNTFAHGGFDKDFGASLHIHLPGIGTVPASMSRVKDSPHFHIIPISDQNYESICKLFDDFDNWLEKKRMPNAIKYIHSGINLPMSNDFLNDLHMSIKNGFFDKWLEFLDKEVTEYENVDY